MSLFNRKSPLEKKLETLEKLSETIQEGIEELSKKVEMEKKSKVVRKLGKNKPDIRIKYSNKRTGT